MLQPKKKSPAAAKPVKDSEGYQMFKMVWSGCLKKHKKKKLEVPKGVSLDSLYELAVKEDVPRKKWAAWIKQQLTKLILEVKFLDSTVSVGVERKSTFGKLMELIASKLDKKVEDLAVTSEKENLALKNGPAADLALEKLGL